VFPLLPKVNNKLLRFAAVEGEVVVLAPHTRSLDHYSGSTKPYSQHYTLGQVRSPGFHQTQIRPTDCQMVNRYSSLQRMRFHCSRVQQRQTLHHSSRCLAFSMVILGLCMAAGHRNPFHEAPNEQLLY
jgi:hypothetical protein